MVKKIRILQIGMHDQMGGIENYLMNYYREIDKNKFQFDFLIPYPNGGKYNQEIENLGGKIYKFSFKEDKNIIRFIKELKKFFKENKYDIIHCNDTGLGVIYLFYAKKYGSKIRIAHSHATSVESGIKGFIKKILQKKYVKYANYYFACSKMAGEYLFKDKKFYIVKNGVDYSRFLYQEEVRKTLRKKYKIKDNEILIGNIGRLCEQKNQEFLIQVLNLLPSNYKLMIIGEGNLENQLKDKIIENHLENQVIILSPSKEIEKFYNAFDIFALSSIYEGLSIVGIEAQVNGLKSIISNLVSKEISISNNVSFLPLEAKKWQEVIENIDIKRNSKIEKSYEIKKCAKELEKIYKEVLEEN